MGTGRVIEHRIALAYRRSAGDRSAAGLLGRARLSGAGRIGTCFALYFPVVRKIGPGKAAYSSALVPIVAMALSTIFERLRWTPLAAVGAGAGDRGMVVR
jgi:drug/metabolite transporter (DMT)-like permease